jgi:thiol-disulfide isomerase/thioredoxin
MIRKGSIVFGMALGMLVLSLGCAGHSTPKNARDSEKNFSIQPQKQIPEFLLQDLKGDTLSSSSWSGKPLLIDFWATWCTACRKTIPELNRFQSLYKQKGLEVISINLDQGSPEPISAFAEKLGIQYPILLDPQDRVSPQLGVEVLPSLFLFGRDGALLHSWVGYEDAHGSQIQKALDRLFL